MVFLFHKCNLFVILLYFHIVYFALAKKIKISSPEDKTGKIPVRAYFKSGKLRYKKSQKKRFFSYKSVLFHILSDI